MKRTYFSIIVILTLAFMIPQTAYCHHVAGSSSLGNACPIITFSASTLAKGEKFIGMHTSYTSFNTFSSSELQEAGLAGDDIHSIRYIFSEYLTAGYGITDDLTISLVLPYVLRSRIREGFVDAGVAQAQNRGSAQGIGDLSFLSEYRFLNMKNIRLEAAVFFGVKTPTGNTQVKDKSGERFETEHQPGSGSWDLSGGLALTKRSGDFSFDTSYLYTFSNKGAQDTYLGDIFNYNLSISYCPRNKEEHEEHEHAEAEHHHYSWDYILEANGEWHQKQTICGITDRNSGSNIINISPGIRLTTDRNWLYSLSVGIPVFQQLDGRQNKAQVSINFGIDKAF